MLCHNDGNSNAHRRFITAWVIRSNTAAVCHGKHFWKRHYECHGTMHGLRQFSLPELARLRAVEGAVCKRTVLVSVGRGMCTGSLSYLIQEALTRRQRGVLPASTMSQVPAREHSAHIVSWGAGVELPQTQLKCQPNMSNHVRMCAMITIPCHRLVLFAALPCSFWCIITFLEVIGLVLFFSCQCTKLPSFFLSFVFFLTLGASIPQPSEPRTFTTLKP
eukprot:TRINITY_DN9789_c0_g2_i1.p1 TRINITY_DN9789_c0_g2~~TRINITY_DN9789_c0_g2_i1.p1  ORF type:complete len:219 (-),score=1.14 TRINITY_DN9789_c0_g2_i1:216-872(-)